MTKPSNDDAPFVMQGLPPASAPAASAPEGVTPPASAGAQARADKDQSDAMVMGGAPIEAVRAGLDAAAPAPPAPPSSVQAPAPDAAGVGGGSAGREPPTAEPPRGGFATPAGGAGLPRDCPVVALGKSGKKFFFLDGLGELREMRESEMQRLGVMGLFAPYVEYLAEHWPRFNAKGEKTGGWAPELTQSALMSAAARRGIWNPLTRVRGTGGWREDDRLVLHLGDRLIIKPIPGVSGPKTGFELRDSVRDEVEHQTRPGMRGRFVYTADEALPGPALDGDGGSAAAWLLSVLATWSWRRGELDAILFLGWLGCAILGGALDWRPMMWLTGGRGTGKSTLIDRIVEPLFDGGLLHASDASAAGIWQATGYSTLPVAVDEVEADADNRKVMNVVKLARLAASGALILRGGADHTESAFHARSCFLFSSINIPPLTAADRSRLAVLDLDDLPLTAAKPRLDAGVLRLAGCALRRRMVDGWPRWATTLERYAAALSARGYDARGCDLFGALLAAADVLLFEGGAATADDTGAWVEKLAAADRDVIDHNKDEDDWLASLLSRAVTEDGTKTTATVARWVQWAAGKADALDGGYGMRSPAVKVLGLIGLKVVHEAGRGPMLAIANRHDGMTRLMTGTPWGGRPGGAGGWVAPARRLARREGGLEASSRALFFGGVTSRAVMLPLNERTVPMDPDPDSLSAGERQGSL